MFKLQSVLANGGTEVYRRELEIFDRNVLLRSFSYVGGQQLKAAALLALSRPTLRSKLRNSD